jgi:hypothetical protein
MAQAHGAWISIKNLIKSRIYEQIAKYLKADNSVFLYSNVNDMHVTQDLNSFGEIIAHEKSTIFAFHITLKYNLCL